jgi:hypothetical protein
MPLVSELLKDLANFDSDNELEFPIPPCELFNKVGVDC